MFAIMQTSCFFYKSSVIASGFGFTPHNLGSSAIQRVFKQPKTIYRIHLTTYSDGRLLLKEVKNSTENASALLSKLLNSPLL